MNDRSSPPKDSIGGTAAAQILGYSKYGSKHDVYRRITSSLDGNPVENEVNFAMHRGVLAEDYLVDMIKDEFTQATGLKVAELFGSGIVRHKDYPFVHATVDRVLFDKSGKMRGIMEVKSCDTTFRPFDWEREDYRCQLEHYDCIFKSAYSDEISEHGLDSHYLLVAATDEHTWRTFVRMVEAGKDPTPLRPLIKIEYRHVSFDGSYATEKLPKLVNFWTKNVEQRVIPDIDGSDGCKLNIMESYPERDGGRSVSGSDSEYVQIQSLIDGRSRLKSRLKEISEEEKSIKEEVKLIENNLKFIVGSNAWVESDDFKITVSRRSGRKSFDKDAFSEDYPGVYEKYQKEGDGYETLKITTR